MSVKQTRCPLCLYEGPPAMFENVDADTLMCRRCRNRFADPNSYRAETSYADCDSRKAVYRFPFVMNGSDASVRVPGGYTALLMAHNGQRRWLGAGEYHITDLPEGFTVYYVCLKPRIRWGTKETDGFGAYGMAQLSLSPEYPEKYCRTHQQILTLGDHLETLAGWCVTRYVRQRLMENVPGILEQRDGYLNVLGVLEDGVSMTGIYPFGFRNAAGTAGLFQSYMTAVGRERAGEAGPVYRSPVEKIRLPDKPYIVPAGAEDVMIRGASRTERHKADETIRPEQMKGVGQVYRFRAREFEFPYGWGLANQVCSACGFFSAHGTISFYIDSTEKMSLLLNRTDNWHGFEEQLFFNVIRQEMADAVGALANEYIGAKEAESGSLREYLSEMSIRLTSRLNGENRKAPVFSAFGLRVKRADILDLSIYTVRR